MDAPTTTIHTVTDRSYFLSEIVKTPVFLSDRKIGKLADLIIADKDKYAEVTHIVVSRPLGDPELIVPWSRIRILDHNRLDLDLGQDPVQTYAVNAPDGSVLLKDYILDKRVLDGEGRVIEVVYDVKLILKNGKLYVTEVDLSKTGLLRRIGMRWLADFISSLAARIRHQMVAWQYVEPLPEQLGSFKGDIKLKVLKEQLADMPPVDIADILEELDHNDRMTLFHELDTERASDTLEELAPKVQRELIASLTKDKAAILINEMTPGQAADILSVLPWWEVDVILKMLHEENAVKIRAILEQHLVRIADFAASNFLRLSPDKTVLQTRRGFQRAAKGKEAIMYLYVLDTPGTLLGVIDLKELLMADDEATLQSIMITTIVSLNTESTLKEAAELFSRYSFRALPLLDPNGKMLGVVTYRDVMSLRHLFLM
jgi:magnesium transporter